MTTLALDIGATKIAVALVDDANNVSDRKQVASQYTPNLWNDLEAALKKYQSSAITRIGVASAGPINLNSGAISPVNILEWRDFPLRQKLLELFPGAEFAMLGDCTSMTYAEQQIGSAIGVNNLLGVVVSTGIGGGLVLNGKVHNGESGNAGLIGHHSIAFGAPRICVCGRIGCLEEYARGPKMVEHAKKLGWDGGGDDFQSLAQSARDGDANALEAIDFGAHALAVGLTNAMMICDVHSVVVGGGVSFAGEIYMGPLRTHLLAEAKLSGFLEPISIFQAKLGADSGLLGAALYVRSESVAR